MDFNASSMSESLAISLKYEWKIYDPFFSYNLRLILSEFLNFFNSLNNSFNLFLMIGFVLINCNSQRYKDVYNYQKNLTAHIFLLHQMLLERCKAI